MATLTQLGEILSTDVLVIGGGISGLVSAIKARELPVDVLVVDKATVGWAGQVPLAGGGIWTLGPDDDIDKFAEWQIGQGEYLNNQEWVYSMARNWYSSVQEVADWGAAIDKDEKGKVRLVKRPFSSRDYRFALFDPHKIMLSLRARARSKGVRIKDKIKVVDLLKYDGRIVGAVGFNITDGAFHVFQAKAVVVASGGCNFGLQRLFVTSTGEGVAMAYRAGAEMRNAEFSINYNPALKEYDTFARGIAVHYFFNARGENISGKYMPEGGENWLPLVRGMVKEITEGRGPVCMDLSKVPAALKTQLRPAKVTPHGLWNIYDKVGVDPLSTKLESRPILTGKISAIKVDLDCKTTVDGLWASGDASAQGSCWTGAVLPQGQFPGWAIAYALFSGLKAGHSAGDFASQATTGEVSVEEVNKLKQRIFAPLYRKDGLTPDDAIYKIQEVVYPYRYNLFRKKERLEEALARIKEVQQDTGTLRAKDSHELMKCHAVESMALCAEIGFMPALMRNESRGTHLREDYPARDDLNWLKWIVLKKDNERMALSVEPVPIEKYKFRPLGRNKGREAK